MKNEIVLNEKQIEEVLTKLAGELNEEYLKYKEPIYIICVLKGATTFTHDLVKKLKFPILMDYIEVSSYDGTASTGVIHLKKDLSENIEGKRAIIFEDIIDTGKTLKYLKNYISMTHKPKDLKICCFVDKKIMREIDFEVDFTGYVFNQNKYILGYGFDYYGLQRNTSVVFLPTEEDFKAWDKLLGRTSK